MKNYLILGFTILSLMLASCSKTEETSLDTKKLTMATSADNPPYEQVTDGKIVGFDIDVAQAIAKEMNAELIVKNIDFHGLIPSLLSNHVDMVLSGVSVTEERAKNVDFSDPYTTTKMAVLYKEDSSLKQGDNLADKIIGVQSGTTWETHAKEIQKDSQKGFLKSLSNNLALVQELQNGNVDLVILENLQAEKFVSIYPNLKSYPLEETKSEFAVALPKGSKLTAEVNEILKKLEDNGTLAALRTKWLTNK